MPPLLAPAIPPLPAPPAPAAVTPVSGPSGPSFPQPSDRQTKRATGARAQATSFIFVLPGLVVGLASQQDHWNRRASCVGGLCERRRNGVPLQSRGRDALCPARTGQVRHQGAQDGG